MDWGKVKGGLICNKENKKDCERKIEIIWDREKESERVAYIYREIQIEGERKNFNLLT